MCGRYSLYRLQEAMKELHQKQKGVIRESYNIAPTQQAAVVLDEAPTEAVALRWGLVPVWAKDVKIGYSMINARAETLGDKPAFKRLLNSKRCVVIADGFYEWKTTGKTKQPYRVEYKKGIFLMAGLWDEWTDASGEKLRSFTIITTEPNKLMKDVHDRMPVILTPEQMSAWLETGDPKLLVPFPEKELKMFAVSSRVGSPKNNDADLIKAVA